MGALADAYALLKTGTLWSSNGRCKGYATSNPKEAAQIDAYVAAIDAGQTPAAPQLVTATGRGLVGMLAALTAEQPPTEPSTPPAPTYIFADDFDGPAGTPPDPTKWINKDGIAVVHGSTAKAANTFLDGQGHLILRVTREPWYGRQTAGAVIGSYQYQTGWPPKPIIASWPVPFRYEARYKAPAIGGLWMCPGWNQNVDRSNGYVEIDVAETRGSYPTIFGTNMHTWTKNADGSYTDSPKWAASPQATGIADEWHVMVCEARTDGVTFYLDGVKVGTGFGVTGRFGVLLQNVLADAGDWGAGGQQPAADDPGPWDYLIDYVRVTAL